MVLINPNTADESIRADMETNSPAFIRDLLKTVATVVEEATFDVKPEGISLMAMDPSHVAMIEVYLPDHAFDMYHVEEPRRITFNVAEVLKLVFKKSVKDASLRISLEERRILFELKDTIRRKKYVGLLEPLEEEIPTPKINFKASARILSETLKRIVEDFTVSEHVTIKASADQVRFYANGDLGSEDITLDRLDDPILDLKSYEEPQKATFTLSYMLDFIKKVKAITEVVNLELSTDMPIRITAELPIPDARLIFYMAPCVGEVEEPEAAEELEETAEDILADPHEETVEAPEVEEIPSGEEQSYPRHVHAAVDGVGAETPEYYYCEHCGREIPAGEEVRLGDGDTILCATCAEPLEPHEDPAEIPAVEAVPDPQEDEPSLGDLYLKYYAEALARHSAEAA